MQALIKCKILSVFLARCSVGGKEHGIRIKSREAASERLRQIRQNARDFSFILLFSFFLQFYLTLRLKCVFHFRSHIQTHWHSSVFSLGSL